MNDHERPRGEQRLLAHLLEHLKLTSDDERLRELAAGVLAGDMSLPMALSADAYTDTLLPAATGFADWYHRLDADALTQELQRSRTRIDELAEMSSPSESAAERGEARSSDQ